METIDFEKALPKVLKRIGLKDNGWVAGMLKEGSPRKRKSIRSKSS